MATGSTATTIPVEQDPRLALENVSQSQSESSTKTEMSNTAKNLELETIRPQILEGVTRSRLAEARTTEESEVRPPFFSDDYGLDELRAPPILSYHERRNSLEQAWSLRPVSIKRNFGDLILYHTSVGAWITLLSILGAVARVSITALSTYPGQPVFQLIWSQFAGCAVMGFLVQSKTLFPKEDTYIALYIGLTTGFCGSLTSFSQFMWNCLQALANLDPHYDRPPQKNVLAVFAEIVITLSISIAALRFGAHCAVATRQLLCLGNQKVAFKRYLDAIGITLALLAWIAGAIMTALIPNWRQYLFTIVLAPIGSLARWQLSRFNPIIPSFPLGTFAANISATIISSTIIIVQGRMRTPLSVIFCALLYGIAHGFCGCLSTISTFAVELDTLRRGHAYVYATASVIVGLFIMILMVGIPAWSVGFAPMCNI